MNGGAVGRRRGDDGFTMIETLVSLAVITLVMAGLSLFHLQSSTATRRNSDLQLATQAAVSALEEVAQLPGGALLQGRREHDVQLQRRVPAAAALLDPAVTRLAWQEDADGQPALPLTEPVEVARARTKFQRYLYVGLCWQPRGRGECVVVPEEQQAASVPMYRVVVAVTWPSKDCADGQCAAVLATLVERETSDPFFP